MDEAHEGARPEQGEVNKSKLVQDRLNQVAQKMGVAENKLFVDQASWFVKAHPDLVLEVAEALGSQDEKQIIEQMKSIKARAAELKDSDPTAGLVASKALSLRKALAIYANDTVMEQYHYAPSENLPLATSNTGEEIAIPQLVDGTVQSLARDPIA